MTKIKVNCPTCGALELAPSGLHLTVFDAGDGHFYEFFCSGCFVHVKKPADDTIQALLMSAEVEHTFEHVPLELLEEHVGPALTMDDLMDFVVAIQDDDDDSVTQPPRQSA